MEKKERRFNLAKDLKRGERFKLKKEELESIQVDLNWKAGADLDAVAFLLDEDGVIPEDSDFVYYKSEHRCTPWPDAVLKPYDRAIYGAKKTWRDETVPCSQDMAVIGSADDVGDGEEGSENDESGETMHVVLSKVRPEITEIVFCVTIYDKDGNTTFNSVRDPQIVITNEETGEVLCKYDLKEHFSTETAVVVGALVLNEDGEWEFEAVGKGYDGGIETLLDMYA